MFQFADDEKSRIAKLEDNSESCLEYLEHYKKLTPWEGIMAGYWICAADKRFIDDYLEGGRFCTLLPALHERVWVAVVEKLLPLTLIALRYIAKNFFIRAKT